MEIRNFTQFINLLRTNNIIELHPIFNKLNHCSMIYESSCNCGSSNKEKLNKLNECNLIYRESVGFLDMFKAHMFMNTSDSSIWFYMNDSHIKTLSR